MDAINALPASPATSDEEMVASARKAYDSLTDDQKKDERLTAEVLKKLTDAEAAIQKVKDEAETADAVKSMIDKLPSAADVALSDEAAIKAARNAYDALTADQKKLIDAATVQKLTDVEASYQTLDTAAKKIKTVTVNARTLTAKKMSAAIAKAGASEKYVTKIVIGKKVKKIRSGAFKKTRAKTLVVRTKKLKKSSVKNSLKGSSITIVQVKIGGKKINTKYVKKYKKIFTKKNAGRRVTVKR